MSIRLLTIAAAAGLSAIALSGCVETTGPYYGGYGGYGGYYGTTVYGGFYDGYDPYRYRYGRYNGPYRYGRYNDPYRYGRYNGPYRYGRYNDPYRYDRYRGDRPNVSQGGDNRPSANPQPSGPPSPPSGDRGRGRVFIPPPNYQGGSGRSHQ